MTLCFMIKTKYLEEKVREQEKIGKFYERRAYKRFWRYRIGSTHSWSLGGNAVFLCGRNAWHADILNVVTEKTPNEIKDIVKTKACYVVECKFTEEEFKRLLVRFPSEPIEKT